MIIRSEDTSQITTSRTRRGTRPRQRLTELMPDLVVGQ
jgi:hypothetical protein